MLTRTVLREGRKRRHMTNQPAREQMAAILSEYYPGDDVLESLRSQNSPEGMVRVLGLMKRFEQSELQCRPKHRVVH